MSRSTTESREERPRTSAEPALARVSARFGVVFAVCQLAVMIVMVTVVLPHGGSPDAPAALRGRTILEAETIYRSANYAFMAAGSLLIGFLGVVHLRLRSIDPTGVLAAVAVASGTLLALIWPYSGVLHDVALDAAVAGTDVRLLAAWDAVPPLSLAFAAFSRILFVGALVMGLRLAGSAPRLQWWGMALVPLSLVGSLTLVLDGLFPVLALSTLGYELWVGALAWHWLRDGRPVREQRQPAVGGVA